MNLKKLSKKNFFLPIFNFESLKSLNNQIAFKFYIFVNCFKVNDHFEFFFVVEFSDRFHSDC